MTEGVRRAIAADRATVLELLFEGFKDDPSTRWSLPADGYEERLRAWLEIDIDEEIEGGGVWLTSGGESVAMWSAPATRQERRALVEKYLEKERHIYGERYEAVLKLELAIVDALPQGPDRYLEALATRVDSRQRGHARAVLGPGLERCEREGVGAVLDADDPEVLPIYAGLGFSELAEVRLEGAPPAWVLGRGTRS